MAKVILQPIGNDNPIDSFKERNSRRWAEKNKYKKQWEESEGAIVLFTHEGAVFVKATIKSIEESSDPVYPLDYYYDDIKFMNIAFSKIRGIASFSDPYRNYTVLGEQASKKIIEYFELSKVRIYKNDGKYQRDIDNASLLDIKDESESPKKPKKKKNRYIYPRSRSRAKLALHRAEYKCEVDINHVTFKSSSSKKNYVEAHHLIPFETQDEIDYNIDVTHNIISLCPNCHRKIHFSSFDDKKDMLDILYKKHSDGLRDVNLDIGIESLYSIYRDYDLSNE